MVKRSVIKSINNFIPSLSGDGYKNIEQKLNFSSLISQNKPHLNKKKMLKTMIPVSIFAATSITLGIIIPSIFNRNKSKEVFFSSKNSSSDLAICEAIDYQKSKSAYQQSDAYNVEIMVANLYYGKKSDGSIGLLVGTEDNPGYSFEAINISLNNSDKQLIKEYSVDMNEYSKQANGILNNNENIVKNDFRLSYSFNLIELINESYDDTIHFDVNYVESNQIGYTADTRIFGRRFSLHLTKGRKSIALEDLKMDYETDVNQLPSGDIHYMDVIDMFSDQPFEYEKPNYVHVHLNPIDAILYSYEDVEANNILSNFSDIVFYPSSFGSFDELVNGNGGYPISVACSFSYKEKTEYSKDAVVFFYIFKDGTVHLHDNRGVFVFSSGQGVIDYDSFYNSIK